MNCFVCGRRKEDHQVWYNKIVIGATYDSEFQNDEIICKMTEESIICHDCMQMIKDKVDANRK